MNVLKRLYYNINPKQLNLSLMEFVFCGAFATYYPFIVVFLQSKGFSNTTIGTMLSINSFIIVFAQPIWGMISDHFGSVKKVFLLCIIMCAIIMQFIPIIYSAIGMAILLIILTIFESPTSPLMDSWIIQEIRDEPNLSFGTIRLWGSLGFSISAFLFGLLIDKAPMQYNFIIFAFMIGLTILLSRKIEDRGSGNSSTPSVNFREMQVGQLFKNYSYITFLIFSIVIYIPHKASSSFLPSLLASVGAKPGSQGIAAALMAFSEVPFFLIGRRLLKRYKPVHLILASSFFFLLRQVAYLTASSPVQVILAQLIQGPSFALFLNGAVYYIDSLAPDKLKSTAQTLATSLYGGISGIIANYSGGWVIDNLGIKSLYTIGIYAIITITSLFIASLALDKNRQSKNAGSV